MLYGMANNNNVIPAERDGALYNFLLGDVDYVFEGIGNEFQVTSSASSFVVTLGTGEGVVCGRHVVEETDSGTSSTLTLGANTSGYIAIRVDLSRPSGTEAYLVATPSLYRENLNATGNIRDLPLYRYTTNSSGVSSITDVRNLSSGSNVVTYMDGGNLYVEYLNNGVKAVKQVGSLDSAELTATASDVKEGVIFGGTGSDEPIVGTFSAQTKVVVAGTENKTVTPDTGKYLSEVTVQPTPSQSKTVTADTSAKTVRPDTGYYLSSVVVNPTPAQSKTATASTSNTTVSPDNGYYLSSVTVKPTPTETKTITPTTTAQTVTPSSGKYFSSVTVSAYNVTGKIIASKNNNTLEIDGSTGGEKYIDSSVTFTAQTVNFIIACGDGISVSGTYTGLNARSFKVYATQENGTEVECTYNSSLKVWKTPSATVKYKSVRVRSYVFSGSLGAIPVVGCIYVFGY